MVHVTERDWFRDRSEWAADARTALSLFEAGELDAMYARDLQHAAFILIGVDDLTEEEFYPIWSLFDAIYRRYSLHEGATEEAVIGESVAQENAE